MIDLNTGPTAGGTAVNLTGTNFVVGMTTVTFGTAQAANVVVNSTTTLSCVSPPNDAGPVNVQAQVAGVQSLQGVVFTYTGADAPVVIVMNMDGVAGAGIANTSGTGARDAVNTATVRIQFSKPAAVDTSVAYEVSGTATAGQDYIALPGVAVVKAGASFFDIVIFPLDNGRAQGPETVVITLDSGSGFKVGAAFSTTVTILAHHTPVISGVFPQSGTSLGDDLIEISGDNFNDDTLVKFGGIPATEIDALTPQLIVCRSPASTAGLVDVSIQQDIFSSTLIKSYLYVPPPAAKKILPRSGPTSGGTAVTITGTNFSADAEVEIDGEPCSNIVVVNATTITCVTPPGIAGPQSVDVFISGIPAVLLQGFTYSAAAPVITSPLTATASKGAPFSYTITANHSPVTFSASNLPPGLKFSGVAISGTPAVGGIARIQLTASGGTGSDSETLVLTIAPGAGNVAPVLQSVSATPNPAVAGMTVLFSAAAADANGDLLDYTWDLGDGSAALGASVAHVFAAAGIYKVTVTVNDGAATDSKILNVAVNAGNLAHTNQFSIAKAEVKFSFPAAATDSLTLSGGVPVPSPFDPTGKNVTLAVGALKQTLQLDRHGRFTSADRSVTFRLMKIKNGVASFKFSIKSSSLFGNLSSLGFVNAGADAPGIAVTLPVVLSLDGSNYVAIRTVIYTISKSKGTGK
jgi:hypothetical protein